MLLKNAEILAARESLQKLMEQKFPIKTSFELAKLATKLQDPWKNIEDVKNGLVKTYGEGNRIDPQLPKKDDEGEVIKDAEDKPVMEDNPNFEKFLKEFEELLALEVEVVIQPVKLPEKVAATCDKCNHNMDKTLEIEPGVLVALEKFITVG